VLAISIADTNVLMLGKGEYGAKIDSKT
jgi:hypothetical protein